jgi:hypothetical protein
MTTDTTPTATTAAPTTTDGPTPEERLLSASLLVAPVVYLAADTTYAARGWEADGTGGVLAVLAGVLYGLVALQVAGRLPRGSWLRAAIVVVGLVGVAGNVAYGFDSIHVSLGEASFVDRSGAATLIKPLGLCFPLGLALMAAALLRLGARWQGALVLLGALVFPVAHIGNLPALAVAGHVALVLGLASLLWQPPTERG